MQTQHYVTIHTPTDTMRFQVTDVDRTQLDTVLLTLQDGASNVQIEGTYPATFEADTWQMEGEFKVYDCLAHEKQAVIIGIFRRCRS